MNGSSTILWYVGSVVWTTLPVLAAIFLFLTPKAFSRAVDEPGDEAGATIFLLFYMAPVLTLCCFAVYSIGVPDPDAVTLKRTGGVAVLALAVVATTIWHWPRKSAS